MLLAVAYWKLAPSLRCEERVWVVSLLDLNSKIHPTHTIESRLVWRVVQLVVSREVF